MPCLRPTASSTRRPSGTTSRPIPSPSITAILYFFKSVSWLWRVRSLSLACKRAQRAYVAYILKIADRLNDSLGFFAWPFRKTSAVAEFICNLLIAHRISGTAFREIGSSRDGATIFQVHFDQGGHFVVSGFFCFRIGCKMNAPYHLAHIRPVYDRLGEFIEPCL